MTTNKRKKNTRMVRRTGWGHKKKHRGRGSRGGTGRAGLHKHHFVYALKNKLFDKGRLAATGFTRHSYLLWKPKIINLGQLDEMLPKLVEQKIAIKKDKTIEIDLSKIGVEKLLGTGKVTQPLSIKVLVTSESAKEKIEKAGGKIAE